MRKPWNAVQKLLSGDPMARFELMTRIGAWLVPQYRFKWPQMAWWDDVDFSRYLQRFDGSRGMNADRRWMLGQLLRLSAGVAGDTAECGVFSGASSYLICVHNRSLDGEPREHLMFDSFEGLSAPERGDGDHWSKGDLSVSLDQVKQTLGAFDRTRFYPGWIPERFAEVAERQFSFVHIDVDLYQPTRDSFEFFYPRMSPGGIILCDDYGFTSCPGATKAIDDYLADKPEKMLALSGGGGFVIKGCVTAP